MTRRRILSTARLPKGDTYCDCDKNTLKVFPAFHKRLFKEIEICELETWKFRNYLPTETLTAPRIGTDYDYHRKQFSISF